MQTHRSADVFIKHTRYHSTYITTADVFIKHIHTVHIQITKDIIWLHLLSVLPPISCQSPNLTLCVCVVFVCVCVCVCVCVHVCVCLCACVCVCVCWILGNLSSLRKRAGN